MIFFDPLYLIIVGPAILLAMWAQWKVKSAYGKYSRIGNHRGISGAEAAADMLSREGVLDCRIEQGQGMLSDHYDPREKVLRLSPQVYQGRSLAAVGIACHEAGHALQHATGYAALGIRNAIVPVASIGSQLAMPIIFGGLLLMWLGTALGQTVILAGIALFTGVVLFQLITLPVEFNASGRAKLALQRNGVLTSDDEINGVSQVLNAAAMTYIAAAIAAAAQLLYFLLISGILGGRRD
jgi:hypothetical protein